MNKYEVEVIKFIESLNFNNNDAKKFSCKEIHEEYSIKNSSINNFLESKGKEFLNLEESIKKICINSNGKTIKRKELYIELLTNHTIDKVIIEL